MGLRRAENRTARKNAARSSISRDPAIISIEPPRLRGHVFPSSPVSSLRFSAMRKPIDASRNVVLARRGSCSPDENVSIPRHATTRELRHPPPPPEPGELSRLMRRRSTWTGDRESYTSCSRAGTLKRFFHCRRWHRRPTAKLLRNEGGGERGRVALTN